MLQDGQPRLENPRRFRLKLPMILRESEPGNITNFQKHKTSHDDMNYEHGKLLVSQTRT